MKITIPNRLCGSVFTNDDLNTIINFIGNNPQLNRYKLSFEICRLLNWYNERGEEKAMGARVALLRLHRKGLITLPKAQRKNGNGKSLKIISNLLPDFKEINCSLSSLDYVKLTEVNKENSSYWNQIIEIYHYLGYRSMAGAQIRYLIESNHGTLGALSFSAAAWTLECRDKWLGWDSLTREKNLHKIACNSRFLILPHVKIPNLASHVLSLCRKRISDDFEKKYSHRIVLLETFIEKGRFLGSCYKADNWIYLGDTKGRGKLDRYNHKKLPLKSVFIHPLFKDFKKNLIDIEEV